MSGNSYPSPVSNPASAANLDHPNDAPSPPVQQPARPHTPRNSAGSIIEALEEIIARIRERPELLSIGSDLRPTRPPEPPVPHNSIGPGHEAIVLGGRLEEEPAEFEPSDLDRLHSSFPPITMERLRAFESRNTDDRSRIERSTRAARDVLSALDAVSDAAQSVQDFHASQTSLPSISLNSPVSPPRQNLLPRRQLSDYIRPRTLSDDPHTFLGRHVAAREAAGASHNPTSPASAARQERTRQVRASMERELERLRLGRQQLENSLDSPSRPEPAHSVDSDAQRSTTHSALTAARREYSIRRMRMFRAEAYRTGTNQSSASSSQPSPAVGRLSTLSNFSSLQNLPTPSSSMYVRPLLFEEPSSYVQPPEQPTTSEPTGNWEDISRSYLVRRHVNADGDEHVHNINLDWEEEDWPTNTRERPQVGPIETTPSNLSRYRVYRYTSRMNRSNPRREEPTQLPRAVDVPQRRSWARLNADGDEISSEEEREVERLRSQQHVSALQRMYPATQTSGNSNSRMDILMPMTRNTLFPDDEDAASPRVRINSTTSDLFYNDFLCDRWRRGENMHENETELCEPEVPFYVDPLPMPLAGMEVLLKPTRPSSAHTLRVHKYAALAGR